MNIEAGLHFFCVPIKHVNKPVSWLSSGAFLQDVTQVSAVIVRKTIVYFSTLAYYV